MRFATFIVPTIGRSTLERTLSSIIAQTVPEWQALVIADCVPEFRLPISDDRIYTLNLRNKHGTGNNGGQVRNHGLTNACGDWLAFVDDDDSVDPHYLEWLREEGADQDLVIFRMRCGPGGHVLPPDTNLHPGYVGISFALRREFQSSKGLWFPNDSGEDWVMLSNARANGARIKVSDRVAYFVRH